MIQVKQSIVEQISILWQHVNEDQEFSLKFVRDHALAIVQLSDQALGPGSSMLTHPAAAVQEPSEHPS